MYLRLHQTHHAIGDLGSTFGELEEVLRGDSPSPSAPTLHLYPELYLTGYPLQDLIWHKAFIDSYLQHFKALGQFCLKQTPSSPSRVALVGGLEYTFDQHRCPTRIENVIFECCAGARPRKVYTKALLPNHDIFDEERYFYPQREAVIYRFSDLSIGLMICEDMWPSGIHRSFAFDPTAALYQKCQDEQTALDLVVNLSASPSFVGKHKQRLARAKYLSCLFSAPFAYVNRVGSEDEIVFDGSSFVASGKALIHQCRSFESDKAELPLPPFSADASASCLSPTPKDLPPEQTWDTLFRPSLNLKSHPPELRPPHSRGLRLDRAHFGVGSKRLRFQMRFWALFGGHLRRH